MAGRRPQMEARGGKDGVGTAYSASSRVWFTFWNGIITEVYYPTVETPSSGTSNISSQTARLKPKRSATSNHTWSVYRTTVWVPL